jgi:DNA-binding PadR family transcriptional regulator
MHHEHREKTAEKWLKEAQKGYMRIVLLILLRKKPCHGYEMMKDVEERTEGFWKPTAGGVYPLLQSLEKAGYIKGKWGTQKRKRKIYNITQSGRLVLDQALLKHKQIADNMNSLFDEYSKTVLNLETEGMTAPRIPNPFRPFLEEEATNRRTALQERREHLQHRMQKLQEELESVNQRLAKFKDRKEKSEYPSELLKKKGGVRFG